MRSTGRQYGAISVSLLYFHSNVDGDSDVSPATRVAFIARIGIIAASLVIARRVAKITTGSGIHASPTFDGRRQMIYTDLAIGLSFPLAQLIICEY